MAKNNAIKNAGLTAEEEVKIRIEWEVFAGVLDRLLLLAENVSTMVPGKQKDEFVRGIDLFRHHVEAFQDQLTDVLNSCGIDYTCL